MKLTDILAMQLKVVTSFAHFPWKNQNERFHVSATKSLIAKKDSSIKFSRASTKGRANTLGQGDSKCG